MILENVFLLKINTVLHKSPTHFWWFLNKGFVCRKWPLSQKFEIPDLDENHEKMGLNFKYWELFIKTVIYIYFFLEISFTEKQDVATF